MPHLEIKKIPADYSHPAGLALGDDYGIYENGRLAITGTEEGLTKLLEAANERAA